VKPVTAAAIQESAHAVEIVIVKALAFAKKNLRLWFRPETDFFP